MIGHTGELPAFAFPDRAPRRPARVATMLAAAAVVAVTTGIATSARREIETRADVRPTSAPATAGIVASVGRRASHNGRYHAEVVAATPYAVGARQSWTVRLTRRGHRRVASARLTARAWAPETGERAPHAASVRYVGEGRYRIDDLYFARPGWWNVALVIDARSGIDSVAFNVVLPPGPAPVPAPVPASARAARPVVAVVADAAGTELTDFMIPRATLAESGVATVVTVAPHAGAIHLGPGTISVDPDMTLAAFDAAHPSGADYVVVPAMADRGNPVIAAWLRAQAAHGATIVAICDGAWTVASAGLLAGHRATVHWHSLDDLAKRYPGTTWVRDRRYVVDGRVITSTGVTASLPVSIMLVERIAGRDAAAATARRVGVASWDDGHHTGDFAVTKWMYVKGAANALAWWRHDAVAVPVADGVDEIALALTVDAIPRTMRARPFTWSADGGTVTGRQGLRLSVDRARAAVPAGTKEIPLPAPSSPPASALDSAMARLGTWYGPGATRLIAMGMEYPRTAERRPTAPNARGELRSGERDLCCREE